MRAPEPSDVRTAVMWQHWRQMTFIHWRYPADAVGALLPDAVRVQTFDGDAWVGLLPFLMDKVRPPRLVPAVPWLSRFPEAVRRDRRRRPRSPSTVDSGAVPGPRIPVGRHLRPELRQYRETGHACPARSAADAAPTTDDPCEACTPTPPPQGQPGAERRRPMRAILQSAHAVALIPDRQRVHRPARSLTADTTKPDARPTSSPSVRAAHPRPTRTATATAATSCVHAGRRRPYDPEQASGG
jgi:Uncharacterized conserved protein (COG2071)